jgi:hypothetical protein
MLLLLGGCYGRFLQVRPEHLVFHVFKSAELVAARRPDKDEQRTAAHQQTGRYGNPRHFHKACPAFPPRPFVPHSLGCCSPNTILKFLLALLGVRQYALPFPAFAGYLLGLCG